MIQDADIGPKFLTPGSNRYEHGQRWHALKEILRKEHPHCTESWITAMAHKRWPHMIPGKAASTLEMPPEEKKPEPADA
jgi:hypothetical protein